MDEINAEILIDRQFVLGEGPLWDAESGILRFVDIEGKRIYEYDNDKALIKETATDSRVGFISGTNKNFLLAGVTDALVLIDKDTKAQKVLKRFDFKDGIRFNDAKCDPKGRLLFGTMAIDQSKAWAKDCGGLFAFENGNKEKELISKMAIPNGLAFSADNKILYHIDTKTQEIRKYPYDLESGNIGEYETLIRIPEEEGSPDGMCIDENGNLWVALWGGYKVICVDTRSKRIIAKINVGAEYVSSCCFGGKNLDEIFITTAANEDKKGGEIYHAKLGVKGTLAYSFNIGE